MLDFTVDPYCNRVKYNVIYFIIQSLKPVVWKECKIKGYQAFNQQTLLLPADIRTAVVLFWPSLFAKLTDVWVSRSFSMLRASGEPRWTVHVGNLPAVQMLLEAHTGLASVWIQEQIRKPLFLSAVKSNHCTKRNKSFSQLIDFKIYILGNTI